MRAWSLALLLAAGCVVSDKAWKDLLDPDGDGLLAPDDCDGSRPVSEEQPYDGLDNDCEPLTADDDLDADGWGVADDCDDRDPNVSPTATDNVGDGLDQNCDGLDGDDGDGDGVASQASGGTDCDDGDAEVHIGAVEMCNGADDDCDGQTDEDDALDATIWYLDEDGDGFGDADVHMEACDAPDEFVATSDDCDDENPEVSPDAVEVPYNELDDDCDVSSSDDDLDGDGFVAEEVGGDDCDDSDSRTNPSAVETFCDGLDDDCDDDIDDVLESPSHGSDIQSIWDSDCAGCHIGGGSSGSLSLDDGYVALVGVTAGQVSYLDYVEPCDTDNSYLWHKLMGTHLDVGGSGVQMPKSSSLSSGDLDLIEEWILRGAAP